MSSEEADQKIDVHNNAESRMSAAESIQRIARASSEGGAPPREAPRAGDEPDEATAGTAVGNPVEGLEINADDRAEAKIPDESAMEVDGPTAGHA